MRHQSYSPASDVSSAQLQGRQQLDLQDRHDVHALIAKLSSQLQVQVILYFIVLHLLQFFGLNSLIYALKPDLKWLLGKMTGLTLVILHQPSTQNCRLLTYSFASLLVLCLADVSTANADIESHHIHYCQVVNAEVDCLEHD